jgi:hypothetical protein
MPLQDDVRRYMGVVVRKAPKLMIKLGLRYLRIKRRARKAEGTFRKQLLTAGVDPEVAHRLSERYGSTVSLREILSNFGGNGINLK